MNWLPASGPNKAYHRKEGEVVADERKGGARWENLITTIAMGMLTWLLLNSVQHGNMLVKVVEQIGALRDAQIEEKDNRRTGDAALQHQIDQMREDYKAMIEGDQKNKGGRR